MIRVGIYGGTFSPPHNGHVAAARAFMEQMWLDYLYVLPTAPSKQTDDVGAEHRLQMCRLAFGEIEGVYVSDAEITRPTQAAVVDTLRALTGDERRLFFLCGTDELLSLDGAGETEELFRLCYPTYVRREKDPLLDARIVEKISGYHQKYGKVVRRIVTDPLTISSSAVRKSIAAGASVSALLPSAVEKYIVDNHLYG